MKLNLVLHPDELTSATYPTLEHIYKDAFNVSLYDSNKTYDLDTLFLLYYNISTAVNDALINQLLDQGHKVILDQLHDYNISADVPKAAIRLRHVDWFWANEYFYNLAHRLESYVPRRTFDRKFLMPINRPNPVRQRIKDMLMDQDMIYSYNKNPELPVNAEPNVWDRGFNPDWYDATCFSAVVETRQQLNPLDPMLFITEKTYKPIAFKHPFILFSEQGVLNHIHSLGFEIFDNLFDCSYDKITDTKERILHVVEQIKQFEKQPYDKLTIEKIDHNYNLFYNKQRVDQIVTEAIINPILEYAET